MNFKDFLNEQELNEKVSKKECNEALKNKNILVGAEFEMIIPDMEGTISSDLQDEYEDAYKDWQQYFDDIKKYEKEREEYEEITNNKDELRKELADLVLDIEDYDTKKAWSEWSQENRQEFIRDFNSLIHQYDDVTSLDEISLYDISDEIQTASLVDKINSEIVSLEDEVRYREDEGVYEEIQEPYILNYEYKDYIDYMKELYDEYGMGEDIEADMKAGRSYYSYSENEPPEPPNPEYLDLGVSGNIESSLNLDDAPFNNYEIGQYGDIYQDRNSKTWAIEDDESLGDKGVEIKSPPMPLPDFIKKMDEMFDWMDDNGYETDSSTGFHIHMSMKKPTKDFDYLKLLLFTDEGYIFDKFSDRINNSYVKSVKDKLKTDGSITKKDIKKIFDEKKILTEFIGTAHFDAVNYRSIKENHVEFRYMGSNYSEKYKDIISVLCNYAHNMALAADPDYKRKEYILKLQRIFNKMELFSIKEKITYINSLLYMAEEDEKFLNDPDHDNLVKALKKMKKQYEKKAKSLSMYKIKKKDAFLLHNNHTFMDSINKEWKKEKEQFLKQNGVPSSLIKKLPY